MEEANLLLQEMDHQFCVKLCKSSILVVVEWLQEKRYIESYHKLKFCLGFYDYMKEMMKSLDDSDQKTKYLKELKYIGVSIVENLILASKNTKFESDIPTLYKDLLDMKLDIEGDQNGIVASLYMEISLFFLKKSNFTEAFKYCELSHNFYSSSSSPFWLNHSFDLSLEYPFQFYLSQRLLYMITYLRNPTENPPHNPFHYMLEKFYMRSEWVETEFAFLDLLGPQNLSKDILDSMLDRTVGVTGFRIPILIKRAQLFWRNWESAYRDINYLEIMNHLDVIQNPDHSLIDLLEDLTGVLVELRDEKESLISNLKGWLNSHLPFGHRGRIELMVGRLLLTRSETHIEGDLYLECARTSMMKSYGENNPFLNIISEEREKAKIQEQPLSQQVEVQANERVEVQANERVNLEVLANELLEEDVNVADDAPVEDWLTDYGLP